MSIILLLAMLLSVFTGDVASAAAPPCGWYVKRNAEHKQPTADPQFSYVESYSGYYVDRAHGDDCEDKVLYLTFDAGYENGNVEKILDVLKAEEVPAAFFILDNLIIRNEALVRRMADEGHLEIGRAHV